VTLVEERARVIALWVACLGPVPTSLLAEVVDMTRDAVSDALSAALRRGWVRRSSRSVEQLVVKGGADEPGRWCWTSQPVIVATARAGDLLKLAHAGPRSLKEQRK
jgi:hypothetical protein